MGTSVGSRAVHTVLAPVLAVALTTAACGGGDNGGGGGNGPSRTLNSVTVSGGNTVQAGQTVQFTATANFSAAPTTENVTTTATWESSNTGVATVNNAGLATGVGAGNADIRARFQNIQGSAPLAVTPPPLAANFRVVVPNTNDVNVCRILPGTNGDWDCQFDGSASTGGTGGNVVQWSWRFDVGANSGGPFVRNDPILAVNPGCGYFNSRPGQAGPGFVQVVVKLQVRNAAGELSAETINNNVRLFPQNQCGFGF